MGLARVAGQKILKIAGKNEDFLSWSLWWYCGMGAFVGNIGTAALMFHRDERCGGDQVRPEAFSTADGFRLQPRRNAHLIGTPRTWSSAKRL